MSLKVYAYSDSPSAPTGFGTVIRNVFSPMFQSGFLDVNNVDFTGVNYFTGPHNLPGWRIWGAQQGGDPDPYGRSRVVADLLHNVPRDQDLFFFLQDHFTLAWTVQYPDGVFRPFLPSLLDSMRDQVKQGARKPFKVIQYIPIDAEMIYPHWLAHLDANVDFPVAYTEFGKRVMLSHFPNLEKKLTVIPHGTNPEIFFPISTEDRLKIRREMFKVRDDEPFLVCVNRNQPRKDVPRTLQIFRQVLREFPEAKLYLHMNRNDNMGFDLEAIRVNLRIPNGKVFYPENFSEGHGVPWERLNLIYNASDISITTARGGGWELPVSEAMAAGCACVAPAHTSFVDLLEKGRGLLVEPEEELVVMSHDNNILRPIADVKPMADAIVGLLKNESLRNGMRIAAFNWAREMSWEKKVVPMWKSLFEQCSLPKALTHPFSGSPEKVSVGQSGLFLNG